MPIVRIPTKKHLPSYLPVLQPPVYPRPDEFYEDEFLDQPLYTQDIYNYQTTMMFPDQNIPFTTTTTTYYSNQIPIQQAYTNHRTFQRINPSHTSYIYYNR